MSSTPGVRQGGELATRTPQQEIIDQIRSDAFRAEVKMALPENVSIDRFTRATVTALLTNPELADAEPASLFQAIIKCAQMGLAPDGRQAAITVFNTKVKVNGKDTWVKKAQTLPMIGGLRDILAEYGWMLTTKAVYANDEFDYTDEPPTLRHRSVRPGEERGALVAVYAVATHRDGRRAQRVLHPEDVAKRKAVAKTKNVWEQWPAQMWEKSAGHDLADDLPLDPADKRIRLVLDTDSLAKGEALQMLYGPHGAAVAREVGPAPAPAAVGASSGADEGGQQAGGEAPQPPSSPAPGSDDDFGGGVTADVASAAAADPTDEEANLAALAAGHVVQVANRESWVNGLTLEQVLDDERALVFFERALSGKLEDGELKQAVVAFCRVRLPGLIAGQS